MNRKSRLPSIVSAAVLAAALAVSVPLSASAAGKAAGKPASGDIKLTMNGSEFQPQSAPFIENGSVYLPVRDIGELLGTVVFWNYAAKTVTMTYPELLVRLTYGSTNASVNDHTIKLTAPLRNVGGRIYVPLRFFSEATGANVVWNGEARTVSIAQTTDYVQGVGSNSTFWLNRATNELYEAHPYEQSPVLIGKVDADFQGDLSFDEMIVDSGDRVVTITDNYGEPHIHYDAYGVLIHDNRIANQKKASYYKRYEQNANYYQYLAPDGSKWIDHTMLTDGRTVTVFDDSGTKVKEYDLPALVGKDEVYTVPGIGNDYLIVRPNLTGLLTLINLKDNSTVVLCDKLLSGKDLDYARNNDVPYYGDELRFAGESPDGDLEFWYDSPFGSNRNEPELLTYKRNAGD